MLSRVTRSGLWAICIALVASRAFADESTHRYAVGEKITLYVNKVGPYANPQETYNYYLLPFCKPKPDEKPAHKWGGLGEVLQGNELIDSQIDIAFRTDVEKASLCSVVLDEESSEDFGEAVSRHYWYELFLDDLPIWGLVGPPIDANADAAEASRAQVYTHRTLDIAYNGDRVIHVNLTSENPVPATKGSALPFTVAVKWHEVDTPYESRFTRYLDASFFEHQIHWFSVFNSFMMVLFLTGLVAMILARTLRRDYARYSRGEAAPVKGAPDGATPGAYAGPHDDLESLERDLAEESGWKLVHGDVFRPPKCLELLSSAIGTGVQLTLLVLLVLGFAIAGDLFAERGTIVTVFILAYAITSFFGGYVSGSFYSRHGGARWIRTWVLTAMGFPLACLSIAAVLNTVAIAYGSLAAVPFGSIVVVLLIWTFLSCPLCLFGTVVGRHWTAVGGGGSALATGPKDASGKHGSGGGSVLGTVFGCLNPIAWLTAFGLAGEIPCRVKRIPSPIPHRSWYARPRTLVLLGGLLPFGSIFIELYFVLTSFWNYKVYYVYGFFGLVTLILVLVTACVCAVVTYFLLNAENYHWHWTSFGAGASTGLYVLAYATHYFFAKTRMTGFFQTAFYFGYSLMFCLGLSLVCGSVGYLGASAFVRRIYRNVKCD